MKKILTVLLLITSVINAQPPSFNLDKPQKHTEISFNIYLDNQEKEVDNILIAAGRSDKFVKVPNSFTTFVDINKPRGFTITAPGYAKKYIKFHPSNKPIECKIYLNKTDTDCDIGNIKYNKALNTYLLYE